MVVVVNEVLHGGWLEFLTRVKYDKEKQFDMAEEKKKEYERKREQDGRGRNKTAETCFLLYMSERLPRLQLQPSPQPHKHLYLDLNLNPYLRVLSRHCLL